MTMKMYSTLETYALYYRCPECDSPVGQWCRTHRGKLTAELHEQRTQPLKAYAQGEMDFIAEMTEAGANLFPFDPMEQNYQ